MKQVFNVSVRRETQDLALTLMIWFSQGFRGFRDHFLTNYSNLSRIPTSSTSRPWQMLLICRHIHDDYLSTLRQDKWRHDAKTLGEIEPLL